MKVYLISPTARAVIRNHGCFGAVAAVVIAESPEQAIETLKEKYEDDIIEVAYEMWGEYDVTVKEINTAISSVVLVAEENGG